MFIDLEKDAVGLSDDVGHADAVAHDSALSEVVAGVYKLGKFPARLAGVDLAHPALDNEELRALRAFSNHEVPDLVLHLLHTADEVADALEWDLLKEVDAAHDLQVPHQAVFVQVADDCLCQRILPECGRGRF